mgnify:CR=1 FL=1
MMSDLHHRLMNQKPEDDELMAPAPVRTHGPKHGWTGRIPFNPLSSDGWTSYRPTHAGEQASEVYQPPVYQPPMPPLYYTSEHAPDYEEKQVKDFQGALEYFKNNPDEYHDLIESGDITPEMKTQMYRDAAHGM